MILGEMPLLMESIILDTFESIDRRTLSKLDQTSMYHFRPIPKDQILLFHRHRFFKTFYEIICYLLSIEVNFNFTEFIIVILIPIYIDDHTIYTQLFNSFYTRYKIDWFCRLKGFSPGDILRLFWCFIPLLGEESMLLSIRKETGVLWRSK